MPHYQTPRPRLATPLHYKTAPTTPTHLWVVTESVFVIDAAPRSTPFPLPVEQGLVPRLLEGEEARVHLTT